MKPTRWQIIVAVSILCPAFICADDADTIAEDLNKAKAAFEKQQQKVKADLSTAFDAVLKKVADTGDLDAVKVVQEEKKAFADSDKLPTSKYMRTAVVSYRAELQTAKRTAVQAYEKAVKEYTKKLMVEKAEKIKSELLDLQGKTELVQGAPWPGHDHLIDTKTTYTLKVPKGKRAIFKYAYTTDWEVAVYVFDVNLSTSAARNNGQKGAGRDGVFVTPLAAEQTEYYLTAYHKVKGGDGKWLNAVDMKVLVEKPTLIQVGWEHGDPADPKSRDNSVSITFK